MSVADVPDSLYELSDLIRKAEAIAVCLAEGLAGNLAGPGKDDDAYRCNWLTGVLCDLLTQGIKAVHQVEGEIVHRPQ